MSSTCHGLAAIEWEGLSYPDATVLTLAPRSHPYERVSSPTPTPTAHIHTSVCPFHRSPPRPPGRIPAPVRCRGHCWRPPCPTAARRRGAGSACRSLRWHGRSRAGETEHSMVGPDAVAGAWVTTRPAPATRLAASHGLGLCVVRGGHGEGGRVAEVEEDAASQGCGGNAMRGCITDATK